MTAQIAITLAVLCAAMAMFAWNRIPAAVVAMGASLALVFTGVLTAPEFISGIGDSVVILIAALLVIATGLEMAGVSAWAGQLLINRTGTSSMRRIILIMIVAGVFTALIGMNGAVAAMLPVIVVVAIRTQEPPSRLMIPLAFACLTASKLTLLGTPVNVIALAQAEEIGEHIGFFEWSVLGIPLLVGTIVIVVLLGRFLLPERRGRSIPPDLSSHAYTLVEQYRLENGLHHLRVRGSSPHVGGKRAVSLDAYPGLSLIGVFDGEGRPLQRERIEEGDILLVRGDADLVGRLATDAHLAIREDVKADVLAGKLMNRELGLAEVVIPARSKLIGQTVFPGMMTEDGGLMILAVQRAGEEMTQAPANVQAGDHLLLQGTWKALDQYLGDPQVMVVDSIEVLQKQAVALGKGARAAIAILLLLVTLLAFNLVSATVAAVLCATLMVITGVLKVSQAYRGIDWNTPILIGAMIPLATAMTTTGTSAMIGDYVVTALGDGGPRVVLLATFLVTALITQFISNTSSALVMMPIALATANELAVSPLPLMMGVAMGATASFLTPYANGVSLMVHGPGGYQFGDYWKLGLVVMAWALLVTIVIVPLYWKF